MIWHGIISFRSLVRFALPSPSVRSASPVPLQPFGNQSVVVLSPFQSAQISPYRTHHNQLHLPVLNRRSATDTIFAGDQRYRSSLFRQLSQPNALTVRYRKIAVSSVSDAAGCSHFARQFGIFARRYQTPGSAHA